MKDVDIKEGFWSLGKNNLSHCIMHGLHLISQVERKNVEMTCESGKTSVEKKNPYLLTLLCTHRTNSLHSH